MSVIRSILKSLEGHASGNTKSRKSKIKRCVLHIGTEKTGTSTIQEFLKVNRKSLSKEGILYPAFAGPNGGSQWEFATYVLPQPWKFELGERFNIKSKEDHLIFQRDLLENLNNEISANKFNTLLISSEHFHSRLNNIKLINLLKKLLDDYVESYEVILYLRRQDRLACSFYSTKIKNAAANPVVFPYTKNGELVYYFDFERIYENWAKVFGEKSIRVRLFNEQELKNQDLLQDFCDVAGIHYNNKTIPPQFNRSLEQSAADFLLEINRLYGGERSPERDELSRLLTRLFPGKNYPATHEAAISFYRLYAEGNERLKNRAFPGRVEPLFDDDFSQYPKDAEDLQPSYSEAVKIALEIWKSTRGKKA